MHSHSYLNYAFRLLQPLGYVDALAVNNDDGALCDVLVCVKYATRLALSGHLRSIRRSVTRSVLQSMVVSLVLSRLDFGNVTLTGIPSSAISVGIECSRQADILVVEVRPHQPAALPTSLAEGLLSASSGGFRLGPRGHRPPKFLVGSVVHCFY